MNTSPSTTTSTAAELCREYLRSIAARDVDGMVAVLAADAVSEFPFAPAGTPTSFAGAEAVRGFLDLVIARLLATIELHGLEITEVNPSLAFAEFTSDCTTKKGLRYQNRYVVRVEARDGKVSLWREYFDPRATDAVK
jgi:hypothetical protein